MKLEVSWTNAVPMLVAILQSNNKSGHEEALEELMRLAKAMDALNEQAEEDKK